MLDDLKRVQEGEPVVAPNGFAEEVTRVMAPVAAAGAAGMAQPTQVRRRPPDLPAPIIEPDEEPGRPRSAWPWVLVIILILALAGAAYVILSNWDTGQVALADRAGGRRAERSRGPSEDQGGRFQLRERGRTALGRRG